jgi:hypothetical protein
MHPIIQALWGIFLGVILAIAILVGLILITEFITSL